MSNYIGFAINPNTKEIERAMFFDNYFGSHIYGIQFAKDSAVYHENEITIPKDEDIPEKLKIEASDVSYATVQASKPKNEKEDFLKRCANAYDMGLVTPEILRHLERVYDGVMRFQGGQSHYFMEMLIDEYERTEHFAGHKVLANDKVGYNAIELLAILTHHCQICAEDPKAWHTRSGFCPHNRNGNNS